MLCYGACPATPLCAHGLTPGSSSSPPAGRTLRVPLYSAGIITVARIFWSLMISQLRK
jgi:hypothetical protein